MQVSAFAIPGPLLLRPRRIEDSRGFLSEVYQNNRYAECGIPAEFVQDNHAFSRHAAVVRGLHFQVDPEAQGKLIRVSRGAILDVAVDLRRRSAWFGKHVAVELSEENWQQLWIPPGFAHGYCTLRENTEVIYKMTRHYSPEYERGLAWDDPDLAIEWPVSPGAERLSEKDKRNPRLRDLFVG